MAATINAQVFSDTATNVTGERYLPQGQLSVSGKANNIARIASPGADGTLPKNYGTRSYARVSGVLAFVEGTPQAAIEAAHDFANGLVPDDFAATIGGITMQKCGNVTAMTSLNEVLSEAGAVVGICYMSISFDWLRTE